MATNRHVGSVMKNLIVIVLVAAALSACGTAQKDRALSGAGIGAGVGVIGGPPGVLVGGVIGAGVGAFTQPNQVNLGKPAWKE
jgi:osmotically inducible lipoprotein OsmB